MSGVSNEVLEVISKPCYNCDKVKQCKMYVSAPACFEDSRVIEYLCNKCAKELGYDKRD